MEVLFKILATLGGTSSILLGLVAYFGKLRLETYKADLDATKERLRASLENSTHVTKIQFDKEFSIYHEIWKCLVDLKKSTLSLNPSAAELFPDADNEESRTRRLQNFMNALEPFSDSIEKNKPFYSKEVYDSLFKIFQFCFFEGIHKSPLRSSFPEEVWNRVLVKQDAIISEIDVCCEQIRSRVSSFSVVR